MHRATIIARMFVSSMLRTLFGPSKRTQVRYQLKEAVIEALDTADLTSYQIAKLLRVTDPDLMKSGDGLLFPLLWSMERNGTLQSRIITNPETGRVQKLYSLKGK